MEKVNIIRLTEKKSITRLSGDFENKLINKVKDTFTNSEQQIFLASFYCFLNYDSNKDFVVDFENVWKWLGFSRKDPAKRLLEKNFVEDVDYKIEKAFPHFGGVKNEGSNQGEIGFPPTCGKPIIEKDVGGRPVDKIMLTVNAFKKFCIKGLVDTLKNKVRTY